MSDASDALRARIAAPPTQRTATRVNGRRRLLAPYLYILPAFVGIAIFTCYPLIFTGYLSLHRWNLVSPNRPFVGLANFADLFGAREFHIALVNTLKYFVGLLPIDLLLPLGLAFLIARLPRRSAEFYKGALFVPTILSFVVVTYIWLWILNPLSGILASALSQFSLTSPNWFNDAAVTLWTIVGIAGWKAFGFNLLLYLAGMANIPVDVLDAGRVDGASEWMLLRHIVWPLLTPTTFFVFLTTVIFAAQQVFTPISVLTDGGPANSTTNLIYLLWTYSFRLFKAGTASALALVIFALFLLIAFANTRWLERKVHYEQ